MDLPLKKNGNLKYLGRLIEKGVFGDETGDDTGDETGDENGDETGDYNFGMFSSFSLFLIRLSLLMSM